MNYVSTLSVLMFEKEYSVSEFAYGTYVIVDMLIIQLCTNIHCTKIE